MAKSGGHALYESVIVTIRTVRRCSYPLRSHRAVNVQQLEDRLGVRLIQRTSRQFVITEIGEVFYRHARAALDDVEAAEAEVHRQTNPLSGQVRLSCSARMAQFALVDLIADFLSDNPKVDVIQNVTNHPVDLLVSCIRTLGTGIDIPLRGHSGPLPDSSFVPRRGARTPWFLFAGPAYLDRTGWPATV